MHHIYHTHGFVLSSRNSGEANKMLTIYTREMGLVRAATQGVRLYKSKLRGALQDFTYAKIDLVRGRDIWRVTSATNITSFPYARADRQSLLLIARVSSLIARLCDGEEENAVIFDDFVQALYLLDTTDMELKVKDTTREALELHLVLRIMNKLGYIGDSDMLTSYLSSSFNQDKTESLLRERKSIVAHINKALSESML
jgi:DNA repair protein RecO